MLSNQNFQKIVRGSNRWNDDYEPVAKNRRKDRSLSDRRRVSNSPRRNRWDD